MPGGVNQQDRHRGAHRIEVGAAGVALLLQQAVVVAHEELQLAGRGGVAGQVGAHRGLDVGDAAGASHRRRAEVGAAPGGHVIGQVAVGIDEPWQQGPAGQVHALSAAPRRADRPGQRAHVDDAAAALHQGLGVAGLRSGHGEDRAAGVEGGRGCGWGGRYRRRQECGHGRCHGQQSGGDQGGASPGAMPSGDGSGQRRDHEIQWAARVLGGPAAAVTWAMGFLRFPTSEGDRRCPLVAPDLPGHHHGAGLRRCVPAGGLCLGGADQGGQPQTTPLHEGLAGFPRRAGGRPLQLGEQHSHQPRVLLEQARMAGHQRRHLVQRS